MRCALGLTVGGPPHATPSPRRTRFLAAAAVLTLLAAACGDNSPTRPRPPQPPPAPRVTFMPDSSNPGADAIALGLSTSTADSFSLVLRAESVSDLYGYGLDIVFDPAIVSFVSATAGNFFDDPLIGTTTQVVEGPSGTLVIGQSRIGPVPGVSGSGTLLTMDFTAVAPGSTALAVQNAAAFDSTGAPLSVGFFGGTVSVPATSR